jgi:uncharacterized protein YjbI with pentapeptide repeats
LQTLRLPILLFFLCGLCLPALEQQGSEWTWRDKDGVERTRAELDKILAEHRKYVDSLFKEGEGTQGKKADLSGANLQGADLQEAMLAEANLQETFLREADLQRADLSSADLQGAFLNFADL